MSRTVAAIDLGATSGRVVVGELRAGTLQVETVAQFRNEPIRLRDGLHWDIASLYDAAMRGLRSASQAHVVTGAAIDSWAVDYGLLRGDHLLGLPMHYRDERNDLGVAAVRAVVSAQELYHRNGLQHLPFNTLFQLAADAQGGLLDVADGALLIPDLIGFWATGTRVSEQTNASTTGMVTTGGRAWDQGLLARLGLPGDLFPGLVPPGTELGSILPSVRAQFGIARELQFTTVGSHDTASAVVGTPILDEGAAYISSGTWSLVGTELDAPITTEAARTAGFTNEGGVDGRTRFLKNVMGLWVLSETMREWERRGRHHYLPTLLSQAAATESDVPTFDVNDPSLLSPGAMPDRIRTILHATGQRAPATVPEFVRSILQSLADAYATTIRDMEYVTGRPVRSINIVGGGAKNELLCQLTADATGLPVLAGPVEATAIGNVLVQLRSLGELPDALESLRRVVAASFPTRRYRPRSDSTP